MENGKWKMENGNMGQVQPKISIFYFPFFTLST